MHPARQKAYHATGSAGRQASRPAFLAEEVERLVREQLDVNRQVRLIEVHTPAARLLDAAAKFALYLRRRHRKALVSAARRDAEAGAGPIAEVVQNRR